MYKNRKEVDQHVESLLSRLSPKEFFSRGYSIGRLYYEVGDYSSCRRYVEQFVAQNNNNAAAHKLLGQALQSLGLKEKALEEFKTSYGICPSQNSLVLNICEILADEAVDVDLGRAKHWLDIAEKTYPRHAVTFQLREKLMTISNPDPQALTTLLSEELANRPKDVLLHIRLLKSYMKNNNIEAAFTHSCNVEFSDTNFIHNYDWYKTVAQILKCSPRKDNDWNFQLLLLTVAERMCSLSLTETHNHGGTTIEATELLHIYDQALERVATAGSEQGKSSEFHSSLLQHHRSQFAFHAATFLLKRGEDYNWSDANRDAEPLMLIAWQSAPFDPTLVWVNSAPKAQQTAARRWYSEGSYRCSQSGHYLLSNVNDKSQAFLDRISQNFAGGILWQDKLYGRIFSSTYHLEKIKTSHLHSSSFKAPDLRLPRRSEIEIYDAEAQRAYGNSLHHFVWMLLNYKDYSQFRCTAFDGLPLSVQNDANCSPESLCQLDVYAFLYCATFTSRKNRSPENSHWPLHKPKILLANITALLCTLTQMKWWDCAFKFSRNELGTEMSDIRATLSRGIETVRCIDNHGLDPELLCKLGRIFSNRAKQISDIDEKRSWEMRAVLYFSAAIPLLEKTRGDIISKSDKRIFDYIRQNLLPKELNSLLEECKLYVALYQLNDGEHEKAIKLLSNLKSPQALYFLSDTYNKMALDINTNSTSIDNRNGDINSTVISLLSSALEYGQEALYKLKDPENKSNHLLLIETEDLLREIETNLNKNSSIMQNKEKLDSSDEYVSFQNEDLPVKNQSLHMRNLSSTPIRSSILPNYRTPIHSQIIEMKSNSSPTQQIRNATMNDFMDLTKSMFDENRLLGNKIINSMNLNTKNTVDEFAQLKISVDKLKEQIDECRNECKDIGELKNEVTELKKEISKLKKASDQAAAENELLNLDEEYRANEAASTFTAQLPFAPQQMMPPFNQRLIPPFTVPPNPFQLYGQNWFNLYNQCSQLAQPPTVPGATPLFDAVRSQVNLPGIFSTPDQMFLDVANLVQQPMTSTPAAPVIPAQTSIPTPIMPSLPVVPKSHSTVPTTITVTTRSTEAKETAHPIPANVVITTSDPLPTSTTAPAQVLSVTIPPQHIKGIPHNYQIQMPETESAPPTFGFPTLGTKINSSLSANSNQTAVFKSVFTNANSAGSISFSPKLDITNIKNDIEKANDSLNKSRTLSEKSNTSVDNYDPCPDFKPIIPLPAEVVVTTGEEDESSIFSARAKLYRFADNEWKERGLGEMKLLKHNGTGKVRVLMRREQIHKICANHHITSEMEMKPMKNESKAYIWVANDFAEEKFVVEKLCIRFKTAEIARQFYETFEKERQEMTKSQETPQVQQTHKTLACNRSKAQDTLISTTIKDSSQVITKFGGFTFTSIPSLKHVDDNKHVATSIDATPTKINVFSGLNFKTDHPNSPFKNLAALSTTSQITHSNIQTQDAIPNKSTDSVDEYEPTVEFKPVVPLPALVETKTGEEDETILFEHRAKLLRFIASSKEWKERGVGNIKLLVHKDNVQKVRLLMRREQVMKVCCNHAITKSMVFQKMPKVDKAVNWCAQDFSEGELTPETFCLRFSTAAICNDFIDAVEKAQSKLKDESKAAKEEQNAAKQNYQIGDKNTTDKPAVSSWGDKFKPKQGSWECKQCFVRNEENVETCTACSHPKNPNTAVKETKLSNTNNETKFKFGVPSQIMNNSKTKVTPKSDTQIASGWGDKFKPKQGSWECQGCFVRNNPDVEICPACNTSKNPGGAKPESGWGDKFKPKQGSWECQGCFVRNNPDVEICPACNTSKNPGGAKPESKGLVLNSEVKFKFGIPNQSKEEKLPTSLHGHGDMLPSDSSAKPNSTAWSTGTSFNFGVTSAAGDKAKNETTNIFDGTGVHKFSFGTTPKVQEQSAYIFSKGNIIPKPEGKPALLPTPEIPSNPQTFDFVFKPKLNSEAKAKSSLKNEQGDDSDGNEYASEDEGHHIHIAPIVPLPEKITVVTGEEDEEEMFAHRAKLFIFVKVEWKERGIGVVKILRHKNTAKLRVVMRREQVHKICLNHALTKDITYNLKNDNGWIFAANDFSEGELALLRFCLKFKTKKIALKFKSTIDKLMDDDKVENLDDQDSDVEFITETKSNENEKQRAKLLMLPENFYLYENKEPCPGCRGCEDEQTEKPMVSDNNIVPITFQGFRTTATATPLNISSFAPNESLYFTPNPNISSISSLDFRTPSGSEASSKREDKVIQKPNPFLFDKQSSILKPSTFTPPMNINNTSSTQAGITSENLGANPKSIFATGNLGLPQSGTSNESRGANPKSIFASGNSGLPQTGTSNESRGVNPKSIFATGDSGLPQTGIGNESRGANPKSIFATGNSGLPQTGTSNESRVVNPKSIFATGDSGLPQTGTTSESRGANPKSIFVTGSSGLPQTGTTNESRGANPKSIFASGNSGLPQTGITSESRGANPKSIFAIANSGTPQNANFGFPSKEQNEQKNTTPSVFGSQYGMFDKSSTTMPSKTNQSIFSSSNATNYFGNGKSIFSQNTNSDKKTVNEADTSKTDLNTKELILGSGNELSFDAYSNKPVLQLEKNPNFKWEGAGQQLFAHVKPETAKDSDNDGEAGNGDNDYDPHYEPIVPLPDKIVVTTGEEDEEKIFGQRCKLFRFNYESKEWKERGVGELKILHHPEKKTYRLLFRREQVYKAVLNMLLFADFPELLPLKKSVCAWTWSGRNFAESDEGAQELLAVRFKNVEMANEFENAVKTCVRKLQAAAAQSIREEQENIEKPKSIAHLRLPKHLEVSARADNDMAMSPGGYGQAVSTAAMYASPPAAPIVASPPTAPMVASPPASSMFASKPGAPMFAFQPAAPMFTSQPVHTETGRLLFQADYTQDDDENENYDRDYYGEEEKLQAVAAQAIREEQENIEKPKSIGHLRLPKHLEVGARADNDMAMSPGGYGQAVSAAAMYASPPTAPMVASPPATSMFASKPGAPMFALQPAAPMFTSQPVPTETGRLLFQADYTQDDDVDENYDHDYYGGEDEWEPFTSECSATVMTGDNKTYCSNARVSLVLDPDVGVTRLMVVDENTGEQLNDQLLQDETDLQLSDRTCSWSGVNCQGEVPVEVTVTATFPDEETAMKFFDCCESTRGANRDDDDDDEDDDDSDEESDAE